MGPGKYDVKDTLITKRVKGGKFLPLKKPDSPEKAAKEAEGLGPGEYHMQEVADMNQWRKDELKEYTRLLAEQRRDNHETVKQRRDVLDKMKLSLLEMEKADKNDRMKAYQKYIKNKHPFNSTEERRHEQSQDHEESSQGPGPGSYNPIAETIMGRYIKQQMHKEKVKVVEAHDRSRTTNGGCTTGCW